MAMIACQDDTKSNNTTEPTSNTVVITITTPSETRTHLDTAEQMVRWDAGDKIVVIENDERYVTSEGAILDTEGRAHFNVTMDKDTTADSYYYDAIYPAENVLFDEGVYGELVKVILPAVQHPTAISFDGNADMLVSKRQTFASQPTSLDMRFKRLVAMCCLTLENMPAESTIRELTISTAEEITLAGCNLINGLEGEVVEYGYAEPSSSIHLIFDTPHEVSQPIYFTCNPLTLTEGDYISIELTCSDGSSYTRVVTIPEGRTLTFAEGDMSHFTVDMSTEKCSYLFRRTTSITSGKRYLLAADGYIAVPTTLAYDYIEVTEGDSDDDGEIIQESLNNAYIIETSNSDYTIRQYSDNRYLYQKSSYDSFNFNASPTSGQYWDIKYNGDNTFTITNNAVNKFVQYNRKYTSMLQCKPKEFCLNSMS